MPIISSDQGSIPEIIKNGINGFIIDPENIKKISQRVIELIDNNDLELKWDGKIENCMKSHIQFRNMKRI